MAVISKVVQSLRAYARLKEQIERVGSEPAEIGNSRERLAGAFSSLPVVDSIYDEIQRKPHEPQPTEGDASCAAPAPKEKRRRGRPSLNPETRDLYEKINAKWDSGKWPDKKSLAGELGVKVSVIDAALDWRRKRKARSASNDD